MSDTNKHDTFWDLLENVDFGMLITQDGETLRSRPMASNVDRENGKIHFLTKRGEPKVEEMVQDRDIAVAYVDQKAGTWISVSGRGSVSTNMELIERYWDIGAEANFGNEAGKSDVAVITLHPTQAEFWNNDQSTLKNIYEFGKGYFTDESPDLGTNAKLDLGKETA